METDQFVVNFRLKVSRKNYSSIPEANKLVISIINQSNSKVTMKYIIFLTLLFLLLVDAKVVKGGKKKKKKKKKPFNANKFKSTMAKAKRRSKEKASKICTKIVSKERESVVL